MDDLNSKIGELNEYYARDVTNMDNEITEIKRQK